LRLTYDDVVSVRPDIVYCQAQGYSSTTEKVNDPAYDDVIQAATGVADVFMRATGRPGLAPTIMADKVCGLTIVYAVLAALLHRERGGSGQHIEVPMVDVMSSFMLVEHGADAIAGAPDARAGYRRILTENRRPQETKDGWIHILPYTGEHYEALFRIGGRTDLLGDPRYGDLRTCIANGDFLYQAVQTITPQRTTAEWLEICTLHSIPATRVATLEDLVAALPTTHHPVLGDYKMIPPPVRFSQTDAGLRRYAPLIGQHTAEVLGEIGYTTHEIDALEPGRSGGAPSVPQHQ
jgi:crotonobetainyl-CoA:carnitine CoA-transferase CaiB-like acyl-CoA transferase